MIGIQASPASRVQFIVLLLLSSFLLPARSMEHLNEIPSSNTVDLTKWVAQDLGRNLGGTAWPRANWQVSRDGLSVFQPVNGGASLFASDFDASGSDLEGEIYVDRVATINGALDDDYIGFALGYNIGDNENQSAQWYLLDWKKNTQTLSSNLRYCNTANTGQAGFAISEVRGTPHNAELWAHSNYTCNPEGSVREMARGINYGSVGWEYETAYQIRFEVQEHYLLAFINGQLELNITGSFNATGSFCYYNLSQGRVRYSGFTRETSVPSTAPSTTPTLSPTDATSTLPTSSPIPPNCIVSAVSSDGTIRLSASDVEGISGISLDEPNPALMLAYNLIPGDTTVDIAIEINNDVEDIGFRFRELSVVVQNMAGITCSFPTIGSILDDDCTSNDGNCLPDAPIEFPLASNYGGDVPIFNFSAATLFVEPEYGEIQFNGTNLRYVPTWTNIQHDAFAIESTTIYGDSILFSVVYFGSNQTLEVQMDILGRWQDYIWYDDDYDGETANRRLESLPTLKIEWHHRIPKGVFNKEKYKIAGIDKEFLNRAENGILLLREDHRNKGAPISAKAYNKLWEDELDTYLLGHGKLPDKAYVESVMLDKVAANSAVARMEKRGIANHGQSYSEWNKPENRPFKMKKMEQLNGMKRQRVLSEFARKSPCSSCQKAFKRASKIPVVGRFVTMGLFAYDVLVDGRPISEALLDYGQDAIPVWGDLRGAYSLLYEFEVFESLGLNLNADSLELLVWNMMLEHFNVLDGNSMGLAGAYPDPHFTTFHRQFYDFHGECDMIFVRNSLLEIHIRTISRGSWSTISGVGVQIGNDIVEADSSGNYLNGTSITGSATTVGGGYPLAVENGGFLIQLWGPQFIKVRQQYQGHLDIQISAHGSDFWDSNGMSGKWDERGFIGRDGVTSLSNALEFAMEWEVNSTKGDPQLFRRATTARCRNTEEQPPPSEAAMDLAKESCANIVDDALRNQCIFDVSHTGDPLFADNKVYTEPFQPHDVCQTTSEACELRGGRCVWRCNPDVNLCDPDLCASPAIDQLNVPIRNSNLVEGCSCALRLEPELGSDPPTQVPSTMPTVTPGPTKIPSLAPSQSDRPSITSSQAPSESPSQKPSDEPTVTPGPTKIPSLPPSQSDRPSITRSQAPSESPSQKPSDEPTKTESQVPTDSSISSDGSGNSLGISLALALVSSLVAESLFFCS